MSLRVVIEGATRILKFSVRGFPLSSGKAANGMLYKERSGTMISGLSLEVSQPQVR